MTKASEIEGRKFQIVVRDDLRLDAKLLVQDRENDLALVKVTPSEASFRPVNFSTEAAVDSSKGELFAASTTLPKDWQGSAS